MPNDNWDKRKRHHCEHWELHAFFGDPDSDDDDWDSDVDFFDTASTLEEAKHLAEEYMQRKSSCTYVIGFPMTCHWKWVTGHWKENDGHRYWKDGQWESDLESGCKNLELIRFDATPHAGVEV